MTSRERVTKTVNRQKADRIPIDLGGMKASGIAASAYHRVKQRLGIRTPTRVADARFMIAEVENAVRERLHLDVMPLDWSTAFNTMQPDSAWSSRTLFDGTPVLIAPDTRIGEDAAGNWILLKPDGTPTSFRMPRNGFYFDDCSFDEAGGIDPCKFKPVMDLPDEQLAQFARYAKQQRETTDYAMLGWGFGVCFLGMSLITNRVDNVTQGKPSEWMVMLMTEKDTCHEMMDRSVDASIRCLSLIHQAIGDTCFAWGVASDDSGTQRGEFIAPELWAEMIQPHYKKLCDWIHQHTKMKTFFHSCGSVHNLIPHFIEAGIDILNPVQISAALMEPARLKREFGDKLVFWGGGCDTQSVLPRGTPDEVREHVRENMQVFGLGGGYVFTQVHNVQTNVSADNILAMLDEAYQCAAR
jgi:uroporphyrinogen-III decarboxylase